MRANNGAQMTPTLIVTRPAPQGRRFAADLAARWDGALHVIQSPLLEIVPVAAQIDQPDYLIFTSVNGVAAAEALKLPKGLTAWCVGAKTAEAAKAAGFGTVTGPGDAKGLVNDIITQRPNGQFAHIRGQHTRGDICARLTDAGLRCVDVIGYDQRPVPLTPEAKAALSATSPLIFPVFSPRTATILSNAGPFVAPIHVVALSGAVKDAVDMHSVTGISVAARPDADAMIDATLAAMRALMCRS
jgi:uroporphyrinogen-III synthase